VEPIKEEERKAVEAVLEKRHDEQTEVVTKMDQNVERGRDSVQQEKATAEQLNEGETKKKKKKKKKKKTAEQEQSTHPQQTQESPTQPQQLTESPPQSQPTQPGVQQKLSKNQRKRLNLHRK